MLEDAATYILVVAFVYAAFYLLGVRGRRRTAGWLAAWGVVLLFVALLVGSAWRETVGPLLRRGEWVRAGREAAGFLVILGGLGAVLYGGFRFVQATFRALGDPAMGRNLEVIRARKGRTLADVRAARRENARLLLRAWRPGTGWLLVGLGGIGLGGLVSGAGGDLLARAVVTALLLVAGGVLVWRTAKDGIRGT
ncbi:MAG: hypothetical protein H5T61_11510 [Thermoflexales bacterium]|nr:hypothetical protein [Thermoflexales bacterium]